MPELLIVAAVCCALMVAAFVWMLHPRGGGQVVIRAVATAAAATTVTLGVGEWLRVDTAGFLLSSSLATAPVSVVLSAAAEAARPGRVGLAWALSLVWGAIVFPLCTVVPPLVFRLCGMSECRVQDFGGAVALIVSAAACTLLAWGAPAALARVEGARYALPVALVWAAATGWLVSLEGMIDAYTPRIALAALLAPLGGAVAWVLVDVLRRANRHPVRSAAHGVLAGLVAIVPGAAAISFPWTVAVGALAGAVAAGVAGARRLSRMGPAAHGAVVVLAAAAVGYLAPAVSGDSLGFFFSGRITALLPPALAFFAVGALGVLVSVPIWAVARGRRALP